MKGDDFMTNLKEACQKVLPKHPNEYIHVVNEYEQAYEFVLLNKGEQMTPTTGLLFAPIVNKETGDITEDLILGEYGPGKTFKQYNQ